MKKLAKKGQYWSIMSENRLKNEQSLYLRQHQANPVDWYIWGAEAFERARKENKPLLLSVGYSACHWCHVMAQESFADPQTAELMNRFFINVKVDREERPDVDAFYQEALHHLGGEGGWPLTLFLTPDGKPFFGGTYFPAVPEKDLPSFREVLWQLASLWRKTPEDAGVLAHSVFDQLKGTLAPRAGLGKLAPEKAAELAFTLFPFVDSDHGGFGREKKFPNVPQLLLLWHAGQKGLLDVREQKLLQAAVRLTLDQICQGGLYDHIGGGFFRYTADRTWRTPHFEKMLVDNALLVDLLTTLWRHIKHPLYKQRVEATVAWVLAALQLPEGGFATALSADSPQGKEGGYYRWTSAELKKHLGSSAARFCVVYNIDLNIPTPQHLHQAGPAAFDLAVDKTLQTQRGALLKVRQKRLQPLRDEKILADVNGLMVAALAKAGETFKKEAWLSAAKKAYTFLKENLKTPQGSLSHSWCNGAVNPRVFAEDYAALCHGALALYAATGQEDYLKEAEAFAFVMMDQFEDLQKGGFTQTPRKNTDLPILIKPWRDGASTSANGLMAQNFSQLYGFTKNKVWQAQAERTLAAFGGTLREDVFASSGFLLAPLI